MALHSPLPPISLATKVRLGFAVMSGLYAALTQTIVPTLPWLLLVIFLDLAATALGSFPGLRPSLVATQSFLLIMVGAAAAGAGFGLRGVATAPLILIPAYHAGLRFDRRGFVMACFVGAVCAAGFSFLFDTAQALTARTLIAWLVSALMMGVLGTWSHRITAAEPQVESAESTEAIALIRRLHELTDSMDTGLDAPARGSAALETLSHIVPTDRSVVLVGADGEQLTPIASRGATRVPWQTDSGGILDRGWSEKGTCVRTWSDALGERLVLVVPLVPRDRPALGVIVADRSAATGYTSEDVESADLVGRRAAPDIDAAMLFGSLRASASLEERRRLARDIHDGIAQNIAALGFEVDALKMRATHGSGDLGPALDHLRESLRSTLLDVRLHISDLNMAQRPETGLGAIIAGAAQSFGSVTGIAMTLTISEGLLRLPSHVELQLYRLAMSLLGDAQSTGASAARVTLTVNAPDATLELAHDGASSLRADDFTNHPLVQGSGARVRVRPPASGATGVVITVVLEEPGLTDRPGARGGAASAGARDPVASTPS